jgi:hypothetical protein
MSGQPSTARQDVRETDVPQAHSNLQVTMDKVRLDARKAYDSFEQAREAYRLAGEPVQARREAEKGRPARPPQWRRRGKPRRPRSPTASPRPSWRR